jgi:hypothetical protein
LPNVAGGKTQGLSTRSARLVIEAGRRGPQQARATHGGVMGLYS